MAKIKIDTVSCFYEIKNTTKALSHSKEAERYLREIGDGFNRNLFMIRRSMRRIGKIIRIFGE